MFQAQFYCAVFYSKVYSPYCNLPTRCKNAFINTKYLVLWRWWENCTSSRSKFWNWKPNMITLVIVCSKEALLHIIILLFFLSRMKMTVRACLPCTFVGGGCRGYIPLMWSTHTKRCIIWLYSGQSHISHGSDHIICNFIFSHISNITSILKLQWTFRRLSGEVT